MFGGKPITRRIATNIAYMPDADLFYPYFTVEQLFDFYESQFVDFNLVEGEGNCTVSELVSLIRK